MKDFRPVVKVAVDVVHFDVETLRILNFTDAGWTALLSVDVGHVAVILRPLPTTAIGMDSTGTE